MFPCEVLQRLSKCPFSRPLRRTTTSLTEASQLPSSSGSVQAPSYLFPAPSTLTSAVTWGPALWIDIWSFFFLPWNRGWTFYPMLLLCRLNFFFKWPIAVSQPTLSPFLCVGIQHTQEHLFSWPSLLTPTKLSPLSWLSSHRFPFLLENPLLKLEKGYWLSGNGILPFIYSFMSMCTNLILRLFFRTISVHLCQQSWYWQRKKSIHAPLSLRVLVFYWE